MPIRHELKSHCSPNAFQSLHWSRKLENSRIMEHTLLSWERCFTSMGVGNGITTSALLHRGCRGRESDGGGGAKTAHVTTFVESADSRPGARGRPAPPAAPRSRDRTDARRSRL